jgi:hypothetical protein
MCSTTNLERLCHKCSRNVILAFPQTVPRRCAAGINAIVSAQLNELFPTKYQFRINSKPVLLAFYSSSPSWIILADFVCVLISHNSSVAVIFLSTSRRCAIYSWRSDRSIGLNNICRSSASSCTRTGVSATLTFYNQT